MQTLFRKSKGERPPHASTSLEDHNPSPPVNRIGRVWQSVLRIKAAEDVEETRLPIEIQWDETGRVLLEGLAIRTGKRLNNVGVCTFELVHTNENGRKCLTFTVNAVPGEIGGRFSQLKLTVRLLELISTSPNELIIEDILDDPGTQSVSRNATKSQQKGTVSWTMIEKVGVGRGVAGEHTFRLQTPSLPLNAEINVSAKYLKDGNTKVFEIPGKDKFLEYSLVNLR